MLTIGNFDGVHLGHQSLLRMLTDRSSALGLDATVLTFEPHPREFFSPADAPARLCSLREKLLLLQSAGVDRVHVCRFNSDFAAISADSFIEDLLVKGLGLKHLIIGDDFRFGAKRQGDFARLHESGKQFGFEVKAMKTLEVGDLRVSSSAIRKALNDGQLSRAAQLLGRPYSIAGRVIGGKKLGRTIGYPTANIQMKHRRPALSGVYAVRVEGLGPNAIEGMANLGVRPTVADKLQPTLEVHLFDWTKDCYGAHLRVHFLERLRDEAKFDSLDALTQQISRDAGAARHWFAENPVKT